jgi:4-hydroxy-3-methylbut-2-enyl diphosphate reductase
MAEGRVPAYHVKGADDLLSADAIRHKPVGRTGPVESRGWLPRGKATVGVTAGASTPDGMIGEVVARVLALRGLGVPEEAARA